MNINMPYKYMANRTPTSSTRLLLQVRHTILKYVAKHQNIIDQRSKLPSKRPHPQPTTKEFMNNKFMLNAISICSTMLNKCIYFQYSLLKF